MNERVGHDWVTELNWTDPYTLNRILYSGQKWMNYSYLHQYGWVSRHNVKRKKLGIEDIQYDFLCIMTKNGKCNKLLKKTFYRKTLKRKEQWILMIITMMDIITLSGQFESWDCLHFLMPLPSTVLAPESAQQMWVNEWMMGSAILQRLHW